MRSTIFFDLVDEVAEFIEATDFSPGEIPLPGQDPGNKPPGVSLQDTIDIQNPDFDLIINTVSQEIEGLGLLLALLEFDAYAKLHASADIPIVIGKPFLGGAWTLDLNVAGTSKAFSFVEQIVFDRQAARTALETAYNLSPGDPVTEFDLTGGFGLTIDPNSGELTLSFANDSLLLTRAALITELSLGFGRPLFELSSSTIYWGVKAKYFNARLSRVSARFGDITDADELFDAIRDADFNSARKLCEIPEPGPP